MNENKEFELQLETFRKNYLLLQKKYEEKIIELSIIKEMNNTMQQIDSIDQDMIWFHQLECLNKYKGLEGAVLYFSHDNELKQDYFFDSELNEMFDPVKLKKTGFFRKVVLEQKESLCNGSEENIFQDKSIFCYGRPIIIQEKAIAALFLFSSEKKAFEPTRLFFYNAVCDYFCSSMNFLRLYYGKLDEEKQMIQLSRFFSKNVIKEIFKKGKLKLGGEKKKAAVIFIDLKGFTAMSENMQPEDVVGILNRFFSHMIPVIFKHKGTLDKLLGDAIMAVFGAPIDDKESCLNAVKTALDMFAALKDLNKATGKDEKCLEMTVGINYGELVSGLVGSEQNLNYTVIGDTVNVAQRIQAIAGTNQIFLSKAVYEQVSSHLDTLKNFKSIRPLDAVRVKGKKEKISLYCIEPELIPSEL